MDFKSTAVIKHPVDLVWVTMRDKTPELVGLLDDVESVIVRERVEQDSGDVKVINVWQAAPKLPSFLHRYITPEMLAWTDYAEWLGQSQTCNWTIEPNAFANRIECSGNTTFEPAIGGRGTRVTFDGKIELAPDDLARVTGAIGTIGTSAVEAYIQKLLPNNFIKLTKALSSYLDQQA